MGMLLSRYHDNNKGVTTAKAAAPESSAKKEEKKKSGFTEEAIKGMTGPKLRKLAREQGIDSPEELTVGELKAILIEKLV